MPQPTTVQIESAKVGAASASVLVPWGTMQIGLMTSVYLTGALICMKITRMFCDC